MVTDLHKILIMSFTQYSLGNINLNNYIYYMMTSVLLIISVVTKNSNTNSNKYLNDFKKLSWLTFPWLDRPSLLQATSEVIQPKLLRISLELQNRALAKFHLDVSSSDESGSWVRGPPRNLQVLTSCPGVNVINVRKTVFRKNLVGFIR